jgi:hypothetical protein
LKTELDHRIKGLEFFKGACEEYLEGNKSFLEVRLLAPDAWKQVLATAEKAAADTTTDGESSEQAAARKKEILREAVEKHNDLTTHVIWD